MASQHVVVHERIATWARHLRPRLAGGPMRVRETRNGDDLEKAVAGVLHPVVLIDLAARPGPGLEDLMRLKEDAPDALTLVLDPNAHAGMTALARELGATLAIAGPVPPPEVAALLVRWAALARSRTAASGWSGPREASDVPEPWSWLGPWIEGWLAGAAERAGGR